MKLFLSLSLLLSATFISLKSSAQSSSDFTFYIDGKQVNDSLIVTQWLYPQDLEIRPKKDNISLKGGTIHLFDRKQKTNTKIKFKGSTVKLDVHGLLFPIIQERKYTISGLTTIDKATKKEFIHDSISFHVKKLSEKVLPKEEAKYRNNNDEIQILADGINPDKLDLSVYLTKELKLIHPNDKILSFTIMGVRGIRPVFKKDIKGNSILIEKMNVSIKPGDYLLISNIDLKNKGYNESKVVYVK